MNNTCLVIYEFYKPYMHTLYKYIELSFIYSTIFN